MPAGKSFRRRKADSEEEEEDELVAEEVRWVPFLGGGLEILGRGTSLERGTLLMFFFFNKCYNYCYLLFIRVRSIPIKIRRTILT